MLINHVTRLLVIPIWLLALASMVPWYISLLARNSDAVATYWYALGARFEPWEWVALVCAMWVMLVLALLPSVAKYQKLWMVLGVALFGFFVQKAYIGSMDEGPRKLLGAVLLFVYYFGGYYVIHFMYHAEYQMLRRRSIGKNSFPRLKINIYHDFAYRMVEKTIFLLVAINMVLLGLYYMDFSQPGWRTIGCVVMGMLGVTIFGLQRLRLRQAWELAQNSGLGWVLLDEQGIHWCFDVIEWTSSYRWGQKHRPVCHHYENYIDWHDVETIGFLEQAKSHKYKKILDFPEFVLIHSCLLPPTDQHIQVLLPYLRTEYFFEDLYQICQRTAAVGRTYRATSNL